MHTFVIFTLLKWRLHEHPQNVWDVIFKRHTIHQSYCENDIETCVFLLSIHLTCWLDLEQYRRTPQKEKAVRHERSSHIATKYLDRKYFFGSDSPATSEQQNDVRHMD